MGVSHILYKTQQISEINRNSRKMNLISLKWQIVIGMNPLWIWINHQDIYLCNLHQMKITLVKPEEQTSGREQNWQRKEGDAEAAFTAAEGWYLLALQQGRNKSPGNVGQEKCLRSLKSNLVFILLWIWQNLVWLLETSLQGFLKKYGGRVSVKKKKKSKFFR